MEGYEIVAVFVKGVAVEASMVDASYYLPSEKFKPENEP